VCNQSGGEGEQELFEHWHANCKSKGVLRSGTAAMRVKY
jgi:hypothetical protein